MARKIDQDLQAIREAVYGEEVRGAIIDGIEQAYSDAENIVTVSETQPTEENVKLWVQPNDEEYEVPTWEEFMDSKNIVEGLVPLTYASYPNDTAGPADVAIFADGADNVPMKSVTVAIEPVQDLHGYDHPWPDGGGKNLLNCNADGSTVNGVTFTKNDDGTFATTGTATANIGSTRFYVGDGSFLQPNTSYILSGSPSGGSNNTYRLVVGFNNTAITYNDTGNGVQFTTPNTWSNMYVYPVIISGQNMTGKVFKPMIRLASETDASFAPYSNICPISGHDTVTVTRAGFNLWDEEWEQGYYSSSGIYTSANNQICTKNKIPVLPNTAYRFSVPVRQLEIYICQYDKNETFISRNSFSTGSTEPYGNIYTTAQNCAYITVNFMPGYGTGYNHDICINFSDASRNGQYEPYKGIQAISVNVKTAAEDATVYGGTLTVNDDGTGTLVVDRAMIDLGSVTWLYNATDGLFYSDGISSLVKHVSLSTKANAICDIYETVAGSNLNGGKDKTVSTGCIYRNDDINIRDTVYTSAADFKTAMSGHVLVYELATPQSYALTSDQLTTLLGYNTVWSDAGQVTVNYRADTKLYIDKKLAEYAANALNA